MIKRKSLLLGRNICSGYWQSPYAEGLHVAYWYDYESTDLK